MNSVVSRVGVRRTYTAVTGRTVEGPPHLPRARVRCPSVAHEDQHPSCDLNILENVWRCRACNAGGGVLDLVVAGGRALDRASAAQWLEEQLDGPRVTNVGRPRVETEYAYRDERGKVLFVVERLKPKKFRQKKPSESGGWNYSLNGVRRVPYRLPELSEGISRGDTIFVVEGEKDADTLVRLGYCATTSAQGAAWKWPPEWEAYFRGAARVVLLPDCDEPGRKTARHRAEIIAQTCADVRIADLAPERMDGYDVTDWLSENSEVSEVDRLLGSARRFELLPIEKENRSEQADSELATMLASEIQARRVDWFAKNRVPYGGITLFDGPAGVGKTSTELTVIALATTGRSFFDDTEREPVSALIVAEEDGLGVLKMRLRAAGADLNRVQFVTGVRVGQQSVPFSLPSHVPELEAAIAKTGARIVYIDALFSHLDLDGEGRMPQQVRRALRPIVDMVNRTGVAFTAMRHWTKSVGAASARALGSAELSNVARSVITFGRHPDDESLFIIAVTKHNLAPTTRAFTYRIETIEDRDDSDEPTTVTRIVPLGEVDDITADDLAMQQPSDPDEHGAAQDWLADYLGDGEWHESATLYQEARKAGVGSPATLRRASKRLKVDKERSGFPARSKWRLSAVCSQSAHSQSVSELERTGERSSFERAAADRFPRQEDRKDATPITGPCGFHFGAPKEPCQRCGASFADHLSTT